MTKKEKLAQLANTDGNPSTNEANKTDEQEKAEKKLQRLANIEAQKAKIAAELEITKETEKQAKRDERRKAHELAVKAVNSQLSIQPASFEVLAGDASRVTMRIVQMTNSAKTTFEMESTVTAFKSDTSAKALAKKTGFYVANALYELCNEAMAFRADNGYYLTSFRPRAVFKVFIIVDSKCTFAAINTKGVDAIRMFRKVDGKDTLVTRSILAQKFGLLAGISEANRSFAEQISFDLSIDSLLVEAANEATIQIS